MSPKINFSSRVNLFKTPYVVQGQSPVEHGFQNGENKSGTNSITRTIRKKPNERSKADRRPSPDDFMTGQRELGTTSRTVGPKSCRLSTFKPLVISTYNVRTLHQQGNTHQLFMGCSDVGIDIIGIQEHRLITKKPTEELWSDDKNWVLVYSSATDQRQGGVGLLMSKYIYKCLQRPKFNWKKLQDAAAKEQFQLELSNRFDVLQCNNMSTSITERYESFENAVKEVAERVVGRCSPCGMPSWVSERTKQLRTDRDVAKRKYLLSKSKPSREIWRNSRVQN